MGAHRAAGQGILVVDDDASLRAMMAEHLREMGYAVAEAADPVAALEIAGDAARRVDLVVTDLVMPKMDGLTLLRKVVARHPDVPVIVVTAHLEARRDQSALGARQVIIKPFDVDLIPAAVREATAR